jgi:hypothetical protein
MVVSKPLKMRTLQMLLHHVAHCGTLSNPDMKLVQGVDSIQWLSRV